MDQAGIHQHREFFTRENTKLSEITRERKCDVLCLQETHRREKQKIPHIRNDIIVESISIKL